MLKYSSFIWKFSFSFFFKITDLYIWFLRLVHKVLFEFLDSGHILSDLLLILLRFSHFLLLKFLNFHVKFFLLFHQSSHLILTFQLMCNKSLEFRSGVVFYKFVQLLQFENESFSLSTDFKGILLKIRILLK